MPNLAKPAGLKNKLFLALIISSLAWPALNAQAAETAAVCANLVRPAGDPLNRELEILGSPRGVYSFGPRQQEAIAIIEDAKLNRKSLVGAVSVAVGFYGEPVSFAGRIVATVTEPDRRNLEQVFKFLVESPAGRSWFYLSAGSSGGYAAEGEIYEVKEVDSFKPFPRRLKQINQYRESSFGPAVKHIVVLSNDRRPRGLVFTGKANGEIVIREKFIRYDYYLGGFWSKMVTEKIPSLPFVIFNKVITELPLDAHSRATVYQIEKNIKGRGRWILQEPQIFTGSVLAE